MIKTALVAMTIVGCDCDAKLCEYIGETPARWSTMADCEAAVRSQVLRERKVDYPLVSGVCRTVEQPSPRLAEGVDAAAGTAALQAGTGDAAQRLSMDVGPAVPPAREIGGAPRVYEAVVDGGRAVLYRTADGYAVIRTGLGDAATGAAAMARRSAHWLVEKIAY